MVGRVNVLSVVLSAAAGSLDAAAYLRVHAFAANMTGNTVLLALNAASGRGADAVVGAVAIVSFVAGSCGGTAYGRGHARPLRAARDVLLVETVLLALVAAIANVIPADVFAWRLVFLGLAAFGMALQQTATRLLHPTQSVSTTYMSGTIERIGSGLVEAVAARSWGGLTLNGAVWLAFALAAFGAGSAAGSLVTVVPCALAAAAAVSLRRA